MSEPKGTSNIKREYIDDVLTFIMIRKIVTPVTKTKAYKLGLVDGLGRVIKEPETNVEKDALTINDRLIFKIKRMLGSRISQLNSFLYIQTISSDYYNNIILKGGIEQRAAIKRMKRDIPLKLDYMDYNLDDLDNFLKVLMEEKENGNAE